MCITSVALICALSSMHYKISGYWMYCKFQISEFAYRQ